MQWLHKFAHVIFLSLGYVSFRLVHVDLFFEIAIKKSNFNIHLMYEHVMNWCKCKKDSDRRNPDNRRISVKEVNTLLLGEFLDNWSGFVFVDSAIRSEFLLKGPFTACRFASWRKISEIQVLFSIMNLISLSMVSFLKEDSEESIASLKELGSPSKR